MAPTKTICKNSEKFSYSGKEMSPLGLGYCADAESVGTEMLGRDGKNWVVGVKNNDKIWMRAPEKPLTPEEPLLKESDKEEVTKSEDEATVEAAKPEPEPEAEAKPATEKPKRKYTKKSKPAEGDNTEPPAEKPKRKYTKKPPTTEEGETNPTPADKKERKKRGPSGYNLYIGKIMKELREKTQGLKTTDYMKQAQELWGAMTKEEQKKVSEELKAAAAPESTEA